MLKKGSIYGKGRASMPAAAVGVLVLSGTSVVTATYEGQSFGEMLNLGYILPVLASVTILTWICLALFLATKKVLSIQTSALISAIIAIPLGLWTSTQVFSLVFEIMPSVLKMIFI